ICSGFHLREHLQSRSTRTGPFLGGFLFFVSGWSAPAQGLTPLPHWRDTMFTFWLKGERKGKAAPGPDTRRAARRPRVEALEDRLVLSIAYGLTTGNPLLRYDTANPAVILQTVPVTCLQSGANERIVGIDFRPRTGQLYASTVPVGVAGNALIRT